ncbi:hypothetical protein OKW39_003637 [Paraburkholderia sp. MM6662-R1]
MVSETAASMLSRDNVLAMCEASRQLHFILIETWRPAERRILFWILHIDTLCLRKTPVVPHRKRYDGIIASGKGAAHIRTWKHPGMQTS